MEGESKNPEKSRQLVKNKTILNDIFLLVLLLKSKIQDVVCMIKFLLSSNSNQSTSQGNSLLHTPIQVSIQKEGNL